MEPPLPLDENGRLKALRRYNVLDTVAEEVFDDLVYLAASICDVPMATLTFVDEHRQWFKSSVGIATQEGPRATSFCAHTILQRDLMEVPDAVRDVRFVDNLAVMGEPHIQFYAGVPLVSPEGHGIGTLCVMDNEARHLNATQREALKRLGRQVMSCLEARLIVQSQAEASDETFALRETDKPYQSLFSSARDGLFILETVSRRILDVNPALEELTGLTREECVGHSLEDVGFVRPRSTGMSALVRHDDTSYLNAETMTLRTRKGQLREVELVWSAYGSASSGVVQGNVRDITARSEAEAKLRESEERYRLMLESVEDYAIYMLTPDGRVASWNSGAQRLKGYSADEIIGEHMARFYTPEDRAAEKPQSDIQMAMQIGRFEEEGVRVRKNGERFWAQVLLAEVRDQAGVLRGFSKVTRDVTERKKAQEAEARSNAEMTGIWDSITDSFVHVDLEWTITRANEQATRLLQKSKVELIGENMWEVFPGAMALSFPRQYQKALDTQKPVMFEETYAPLDIWYEINAYPSLSGLSIYFRDITERKRAEQALRQSEMRFQRMVANAPGMVYEFVLNTDGSTEMPFVNEGSKRVMEMTPEEVQSVASSFGQMVHPDDRTNWQISIVQSAASLTPWEWEGRLTLRTGKIKWVSGAARPIRLASGATLWDGILSDITERKQAEEDRDRFFTLSLDLLCIFDTRGFFKRLNPAFESTLGYSASELMSRSMFNFVHPDDEPETRRAVQNLYADSEQQEFTVRFRCRDGSYKWLSWRSTPFGGLNYAAARDITALKEAEDELYEANVQLEQRVVRRTAELARANDELQLEMRARQEAVRENLESYSLLNAVIEGSPDSIFVKDLQGRYLMINSAGARFVGASVADIVGKTDAECKHAQVSGVFEEGDRRVLASGTEQNYEQTIVLGGETHTQLVSKRAHRNPQGDVIGIVGTARDITAFRQQADALQAAKEEADKANQAKSEFLSRMSHELRTPLNAILGFGQILELNTASAEARAAVTQILKGGWHLLDLVNEVLEISRVEAGRVELSLEPISLADVVPESCALVKPLADHRNIRLEQNEEQHCDLFVLADRQRLKQVLINLLSNAIKYNFAGGLVEISCRMQEVGQIRIAVRDTGPGISEEDRRKLFTPFERLGAAHSKIEGSGLGLALSLGLLQAMGGTLGVESADSGGSVFWIELPATESPLQAVVLTQPEAVEPEILPTPDRVYTVLSVEDNLSNLWLLEAILARRPDINLLAAMQGSMGLDMAFQHQPDLILLDLNLPDIYGADVLAELQKDERTAHIPVIVISADATPTQIERLMRAGARNYLTKPLNVSKFLRTMDEALIVQRFAGPVLAEEGAAVVVPDMNNVRPSAFQVLLVEDNPVNQQVALHQLGNLGYGVTVVGSGEAAIETWQQQEFAFMLLDCNLPGIDGYETARAVRLREGDKSRMPIIALTATASGDDRDRCLAAGMDDYISKPVRQSELAAVLERWTAHLGHMDEGEVSKEPVLNRERWDELHTELDADIVQDLVALFLAEVPPLLGELRESTEQADFQEVYSTAHKLKGSCSTMGVARMATLCRNIEESANAHEGDKLVPLVEQLTTAFEEAQVVLNDASAE